jgi:hypothetical protein
MSVPTVGGSPAVGGSPGNVLLRIHRLWLPLSWEEPIISDILQTNRREGELGLTGVCLL